MSDRLRGLADEGVSIWLDDLSRERINTGNLQGLITDSSVTGVTTNPTIFASALSNGAAYDDQVRELAARDTDVADAIKALTSDDVRNACDLFKDVYEATGGVDGRVSIEVEPGLAMVRAAPPSRLLGRDLRATGLAGERGMRVVAVRSRGTWLYPPSHYVLEPEDTILLVGPTRDVERFLARD